MSIGKHLGSESLEDGDRSFSLQKRRPPCDSFGSTSSFHSFMESYETSKLNYEVTFFTQQLCLMLQRISLGHALLQRRKEPIYRYMMTAVKETMLTEIQVSAWSIIIQRTEEESRYLDFSLYLRISAFAVRKVMEDDVICENIIEYLDSKGGFRREFLDWFDREQDNLSISLMELNEEFQRLVQPLTRPEKDPVVYMFLIDELTEDTPLNLDVPETPASKISTEVSLEPCESIPQLPHSEKGSISIEKHPSYFLNLSRDGSDVSYPLPPQ